MDEGLARLGRADARLRLRIGEILDALMMARGVDELGFSSVDAYAEERCERSRTWARTSRRMARALYVLPAIRSALVAGQISWCMAEVLVPRATPENETLLLAVAQQRQTVRAMEAWVAEQGDSAVVVEEDEDETHEMRISMGLLEALLLEVARCVVERVDGTEATDGSVVDALLGEGLAGILALEKAASIVAEEDEDEARRIRLAALAREDKLRAFTLAEARVRLEPPRCVFEDGTDAALPDSPRDLDVEVRRCASLLASRDLELGRLWRAMVRYRGWGALEFASDEQYARERVGMSARSMRQRATLARRVERLPALGIALESGLLGFEATMLIGRVATPDTVDAWIAVGQRRTVKHLKEEVRGIELRKRLGEDGPFLPPDAAALEEVAAFERAAMSGELLANIAEGTAPGRQISVLAGSGRQARLRVSAGQRALYRYLERRFERVAPPGMSFIGFLCLSLWSAWGPVMREVVSRWEEIHRRDRYRCCNPVCTRRDVTAHHLQFRSHGGTDDPENIGSICSWCHLCGIHGGVIKASPPASNIRWEIGRDPILLVVGRDRTLL